MTTPIKTTEDTGAALRPAVFVAAAAVAVAASVQTVSAQGYDPMAQKPGGIAMPPQAAGGAMRPATPQMAPAGQAGEDPQVAATGDQRLPANLRDIRDQVPPNAQQLATQLGLRSPRGQRTDMRNRTPTAQEIVNALAPRR